MSIESGSTPPTTPAVAPVSWKILIVDDEPAIHQVTKLALRNAVVFGRPLTIFNALSGAAAQEILAKHDDIAMVLLDVVMESDHAGLDLVRHIRGELENSAVRIVLRTGQPGQAPERSVMVDYDINDYKEKTDMTANKLFTSLAASIRGYRDIKTLECARRGLTAVANLNERVFSAASLSGLASDMVSQLHSLELFAAVGCFVQRDGAWQALGTSIGTLVAATGLLDQANTQPGQVQAQDGTLAAGIQTGCGQTAVLQLTPLAELDADATQVVAHVIRALSSALRYVRLS